MNLTGKLRENLIHFFFYLDLCTFSNVQFEKVQNVQMEEETKRNENFSNDGVVWSKTDDKWIRTTIVSCSTQRTCFERLNWQEYGNKILVQCRKKVLLKKVFHTAKKSERTLIHKIHGLRYSYNNSLSMETDALQNNKCNWIKFMG